MKLFKYRVWCSTDSKWEYIWLEDTATAPTTCPANPAHTIDSAKTSSVDTAESDPQADADGALMSRQKIAKSGHHYQAFVAKLKIGHSTINCKDKDGTAIGFWTVKRYDDQDTLTTNNADAVKTVYEFEPTHDISIVGAKMYQKAAPGAEILMFVEAAPQFTPAQGGQVKFTRGGMDLDYMGTGLILHLDGKAPKDIPYDSVNHSGKFEFTFLHAVSTDHTVMPVIEFFMPPGI